MIIRRQRTRLTARSLKAEPPSVKKPGPEEDSERWRTVPFGIRKAEGTSGGPDPLIQCLLHSGDKVWLNKRRREQGLVSGSDAAVRRASFALASSCMAIAECPRWPAVHGVQRENDAITSSFGEKYAKVCSLASVPNSVLFDETVIMHRRGWQVEPATGALFATTDVGNTFDGKEGRNAQV